MFRYSSRGSVSGLCRSLSRGFSACKTSYREKFEFTGLDEEQLHRLVTNPLVAKLGHSPKALEALQNTVKVLEQKGYANGNMGIFKQMKLMMDKDVKAQLLKVKDTLDQEGIELRKEDIEGLTDLMGVTKSKKQD